jgi:hypothetical protein
VLVKRAAMLLCVGFEEGRSGSDSVVTESIICHPLRIR